VVQLHREGDKIKAAGAELIVIGNGAPHFIAGFREITGYDGKLYTDPSLATFEAAEMKRGVASVLNVRAGINTLKAFARGGTQGTTKGDTWQQGGVLVIAPGGEIKWHYASARPGDNPSVDRMVEALAS
jgi:hypothetical protein